MFRAAATVVVIPLTAPLYPRSSTPHAPTPSRRHLPLKHTAPSALKRGKRRPRRPGTPTPLPFRHQSRRAAPAAASRNASGERALTAASSPPLPAQTAARAAPANRQGASAKDQARCAARREGLRERRRTGATGQGGVRGGRRLAAAKGHGEPGEGEGVRAVPGRRRIESGGKDSSCQKWVGASRRDPSQ